MRKLTAMASTLMWVATASAQPNTTASETPEIDSDPLYRIEVILYAFNEGNRGEEDFFHGTDDPQFEPLPRLLRLPSIELESVFNGRAASEFDELTAFVEADVESEAEAVPAETLTEPAASDFPGAAGSALAVPAGSALAETEMPLEDSLELFETGFGLSLASLESDANLPAGFRTLTRDELELREAAARMNRRPYTLLGYAGWEQTGVDNDRSVQVDLKRVGITNPSGTIELYLRRFLHVSYDLEFFDGQGSLWSLPPAFGLTPFTFARSYKLVDERNAMRSGQLYSIDHPLFGMLVRITPAPEPEEEPGNENSGRPAG